MTLSVLSVSGLHGSYSPPSTESALGRSEERRIWQATSSAMQTSKELQLLLSGSLATVEQCFNIYAAPAPAGSGNCIRLSASSAPGGVYKLLEDFSVSPAYLNKKEAKALFALALASQKASRSAFYVATRAAVEGTVTVLDLTGFVIFIVLASCFALGRTAAFNSLYPTLEVKRLLCSCFPCVLFSYHISISLYLSAPPSTVFTLTSTITLSPALPSSLSCPVLP